jgi:putative ABC transport system permease protein
MAILVMAAALIGSATLGFERVLRKSLGSDFLLVPPSIAVWGLDVGAAPALAEELRAVPGVGVVTSVRFAPTRVNDTAVSLLAVDPATYPQVSGLSFSAGDAASAYAALGQGRAVIVNGLLAASAGLGVGDEVRLLSPSGEQAYRVAAIAGDYLNAKLATGYISHANLAADFNRTEDVLIQLNLAPGAQAAATESALRAALAPYPQFRLIAGQAFITESLRVFDAAMAGMVALVIFLAVPSLIAMLNTLAIGVIERTREIGLLRAVGATRADVGRVITAEALILAAIGTVMGVAAGLYLGYLGVQAMRTAGYPMEFVFPFFGVVLALAAGVGFGVLAALLPARQAARLEVVQALQYE